MSIPVSRRHGFVHSVRGGDLSDRTDATRFLANIDRTGSVSKTLVVSSRTKYLRPSVVGGSQHRNGPSNKILKVCSQLIKESSRA